MALTDKEESLIKSKLPRCSTLLASVIGKLYIADPSAEYEWIDTDCYGAIALVVNRRLNSVILRVYDVRSKCEVRFEYEMYFGVTYQVLKPCFHCFEMERHMLGLAFTDSEEADAFANKFQALVVNGKAKLRKDKQYSNDAFSMNRSSPDQPKSLTQRLKGMYSRLNKKGNANEVVLGEVTSVEHVAHIGIDKDGGINWSKIPHSWKVTFKSKGMKKKDFEKNPALKKKLLTKLDVYNRNKRLAPPRPKSAKPKLRMSKQRLSQQSSSDSSSSSVSNSEMSPEKLARYVETFKKMRTRVDDHIIRSAMKKKGIDPALVFGPETESQKKPSRPTPREKPSPPKPRARPTPRDKPVPPKPKARPTPKPRARPTPKLKARPKITPRERSEQIARPSPMKDSPRLSPREDDMNVVHDEPPPPIERRHVAPPTRVVRRF